MSTQTDAEIEESHRQAELSAARLCISPKKDGAANVIPFSLDEPVETGIVSVASAKRVQAEGIKRDAPGVQPGPSAGQAEQSEQPGSSAGQPSSEGGDNLGKPIPIQPKISNFPAELKSIPNWVLWRYLPPQSQGQKWRKVPFQANGKAADTTDRSTWSRFEECCTAYAQGRFDGLGFVFDGEIGPDCLCYCGVDFDACVYDGKVHSLALKRIKRLNTYTERSVSGTGFHCIARAEPLDRIVKFDGVEVYTKARYFTFTGVAIGEIKAAPTEIGALVNEVRAKEVASKQQQSGRSGSNGMSNIELPNSFNNAKPAQAFNNLDPQGDNLAEGIRTAQWFETLPPELKDEVVDCALGIITNNTRLLELEANGGNNAEYYKLTTAVARSGAPHAEDIFVKHASSAKNPDPDDALRQHFSRCRVRQPSGGREITVGTLLLLAQQNGAILDRWKCRAPSVPALPSVPWSGADLKVSFANIPHRRWLYGVDLVRGDITLVGSPGGAGKTSLAIGMAVSIAVGRSLLEEKIFGEESHRVLYINAEDSGIEMKRRTWALCLKHNIAEGDLDRLYVAGTDDPRVQGLSFLRTIEKNSSVLDQKGFDQLESFIIALQPDLVVLDPLIALCGGGNINDNAAMSLVMRELKRIAIKHDCAIMIIHHTRKGGDLTNAEAISGASAIVNLARHAIMPVTMTEDEAKKTFNILPSERFRYFKVVDAKSNLAPRSGDTPWYELCSVELPNAEPPVYPYGDRVQAISRINIPLSGTASANPDDQKIRKAILDIIHRGKMIDGQLYPYSPNVAGANNRRALLDDAVAAVANATAPRQWIPGDLKAVTERAIAKMRTEGSLIEEQISSKGRFRRGIGLRVDWACTTGANERADDDTAVEDATALDGGQLVNSRSID